MRWLNLKMRPTQFGSHKNKPGTDYASKYCPECGLHGTHKMSCDSRGLPMGNYPDTKPSREETWEETQERLTDRTSVNMIDEPATTPAEENVGENKA